MILSKSYTVKDNLMSTMKNRKLSRVNKITFGGLLILLWPALYGQELNRESSTAYPDFEMNPVLSSDCNKKTGLKATGSFTLSNTETFTVLDPSSFTVHLANETDLPEGATITNIEYMIRVDDDSDESNFYPSDYEIYISTPIHGDMEYLCVYDNLGTPGSHNDENHDDDPENDSDIWLDYRSTNAFNGEAADQSISVRVKDTHASGIGVIRYVYIRVSWETPDVNLNANYLIEGWSEPLIISHETGTHLFDSYIFASRNYIDMSFRCEEDDISYTTPFKLNLYIDHHLEYEWHYAGAYAGYTYFQNDIEITFTAGNHKVCQVVDALEDIAEADETDNEYCVTINVLGPPITPSLLGPQDGAECRSISSTLSWSSISGATGYYLQVDNNPDFSSPEIDLSVGSTSHITSGLDYNETYYWKVYSLNPAGQSDYSTVRSFTTVPEPPAAPSLVHPTNEAVSQPSSVELTWNEVPDALGYELRVDDDDDFSSPVFSGDIAANSYEITALDIPEKYYWQVRASGTCEPGAWSEVWYFETGESGPDALTDAGNNGYFLGQNHPNPFMETTNIEFRLPVDDQVSFEFLDMQGRLIETFTGFYKAGSHCYEVNLKGKVKPGAYLYRMKTSCFIDSRMCIIH